MSDDAKDSDVDFEPEDEFGSVGAVKTKLTKLKEEFEMMQEVVKKFDSEVYSPSKTSIQIILEHSRKTAPVSIC